MPAKRGTKASTTSAKADVRLERLLTDATGFNAAPTKKGRVGGLDTTRMAKLITGSKYGHLLNTDIITHYMKKRKK